MTPDIISWPGSPFIVSNTAKGADLHMVDRSFWNSTLTGLLISCWELNVTAFPEISQDIPEGKEVVRKLFASIPFVSVSDPV